MRLLFSKNYFAHLLTFEKLCRLCLAHAGHHSRVLLADALSASLSTETAMFGKFAPGPTAQLPPDPGDGVEEATDDRRQQPHRDRGQIQEIYG